MANKQISDLLEATVIDDAVFFAGEDGISTKKVKSKTVQDYIRTRLFFNFYAMERLASAITLTDLMTISPAGDAPTQKMSVGNFIGALNLLNTINILTALSANDIDAGDLLKIADASAQSASKKITVADLISAINRLNLFSNLPAKTAPANNDIFPLSDSADNMSTKGITFNSLKGAIGAMSVFSWSANKTFNDADLPGGSFHKFTATITSLTINATTPKDLPIHIQFKTGSSFTLTLFSGALLATPRPTFAANTYYEISILNNVYAFSQGV